MGGYADTPHRSQRTFQLTDRFPDHDMIGCNLKL